MLVNAFSLILLLVCTVVLVVQLVGGFAITGVDGPIERDKKPTQYWFLMGIETFAWGVGLLAFVAV